MLVLPGSVLECQSESGGYSAILEDHADHLTRLMFAYLQAFRKVSRPGVTRKGDKSNNQACGNPSDSNWTYPLFFNEKTPDATFFCCASSVECDPRRFLRQARADKAVKCCCAARPTASPIFRRHTTILHDYSQESLRFRRGPVSGAPDLRANCRFSVEQSVFYPRNRCTIQEILQ